MSAALRIVMLGPPGAGKGTQAELLCSTKSIPHISTGVMLREAVERGNDLGQQVKSYLDKGTLAPDSLMIDLIRERLGQSDCENGFLLDGFPRTVAQAEALDALLESKQTSLDCVIELAVDEAILLSRIEKRAAETLEKGGVIRADDNAEAFKKRLHSYKDLTMPLSDYYKDKGILKTVDGMQSIDQVTASIESILSDLE